MTRPHTSGAYKAHQNPSGKTTSPLYFFQFLGAHSLLIGLLPFFLPVYLWKLGLDLTGLSLVVGFSGLSFVMALALWQLVARHAAIKHMVAATFGLELILLMAVGLLSTVPGAPLFPDPDMLQRVAPPGGASPSGALSGGGLSSGASPGGAPLILAVIIIGFFNGLYNAFFWTTQRSLFLLRLGLNDSGKQYGNFQIFVTVFLKLGIVIGGWLLEAGGFVALLALSAGVAFAANQYLAAANPTARMPSFSHTSLLRSLRFRDKHGSQTVFGIDGVFLYLESHFWTVSLFLLVKEDFSKLGVVVVLLALIFAALFFLIKNHIDKLPARGVYKIAVGLYAASWLLRATLDSESQGDSIGVTLVCTLVVITFFSSFFRLAFNKLFFDIAKRRGAVEYLLNKSYSSQAWLAGVFITLGGVLWLLPNALIFHLQLIYIPAAILSLMYLKYRPID